MQTPPHPRRHLPYLLVSISLMLGACSCDTLMWSEAVCEYLEELGLGGLCAGVPTSVAKVLTHDCTGGTPVASTLTPEGAVVVGLSVSCTPASGYLIARWHAGVWTPLGLVYYNLGEFLFGGIAVDQQGRIYVAGLFSGVIGAGGLVEAPNLIYWDPATGIWQAGPQTNGFLRGVVVDPQNRVVVTGGFTEGIALDGAVTPLHNIARWDASTDRFVSLGNGLHYTAGRQSRGLGLVVDQAGRIVVHGSFDEMEQSDGSRLYGGGVGRWDDAAGRWEAMGTGFVPTGSFGLYRSEHLTAGAGAALYLSGSLQLPGAAGPIGAAQWDGVQWTPLGTGLNADHFNGGIHHASDGTLYLYAIPRGSPTWPVLRLLPGETTWAPDPLLENVRTFAGHPDVPFTYVGGAGPFSVDGQHFGTHTRILDQTYTGMPYPGACTTLQVVHTIAEPDAPALDLYVDAQPQTQNLGFAQATPMQPFADATGTHQMGLALAGSTEPALVLQDVVLEDRRCVTAATGLLNAPSFAPNPNGHPTSPALTTADVSDAPGKQHQQAGVLLLHAVTDAPDLDVVVRETGQRLAEGLAFGTFAPLQILEPGTYTLALQHATDGTGLGHYTVTVASGLSTLALTGFLDPSVHPDAPPMALAVIDEDGTTLRIPTHTETAPPPAPATLHAPYPNPFSGQTTLGYTLAQPAHVHLALYDLHGRAVATLVDAHQPAGPHAVALTAAALPAGRYLYRLRAGNHLQSRILIHLP